MANVGNPGQQEGEVKRKRRQRRKRRRKKKRRVILIEIPARRDNHYIFYYLGTVQWGLKESITTEHTQMPTILYANTGRMYTMLLCKHRLYLIRPHAIGHDASYTSWNPSRNVFKFLNNPWGVQVTPPGNWLTGQVLRWQILSSIIRMHG